MLDRLESARAALPNLSVETFVSRATREEELASIPAWIARSTGRIDVEALVQRGLVGTGREFYLCGPRAMMESLISGLRRHGIPGKQIHFEAFAM